MQAHAAEPLTKLQRTVEILHVLNQHGAFGILRELNEAFQRAASGVDGGRPAIPPDIPPRVRTILEDLGPTFIKVGQLLGTRPDLVPAEFCAEFQSLYDSAPADPFPIVQETVEAALGKPLTELFAAFDPRPIASASVGQVHVATLPTGERVAVKVQHPGIEQRVSLDFRIFEPIAGFIERVFAAARIWQPTAHLHELWAMLRTELDYTVEARHLQRAHDLFRDNPDVKIPRVYWGHSSRRVLTLEYIDGLKLEDPEVANLPQASRRDLARVITHAMGTQIFEHRFFHADPSPGNLLIVDGHTIALLDWGAVGIVSRRRAEQILHLMVALMRDDLDGLQQALMQMCHQVGPTDPVLLKRDLEKALAFQEATNASVANPELMDLIIDIGRKHNLLLPPDFILVTRALFQFDGMCRRLDPDFELVEVLGPLVQGVLFQRYTSGARQREALVDFGIQSIEFLKVLPGRLSNVLRKVEQDQLTLRVEVPAMAEHHRHQRSQVVRASVAAYSAAIILGTALLLANERGEVLPQFLFIAALVVIVWALALLMLENNERRP